MPVRGVSVESGGEVTFNRSAVRDCGGDGISFAKGARGEVVDCTFTGNEGHGIRIDTEQPVVVRGCTVRDNGGAGLASRRRVRD